MGDRLISPNRRELTYQQSVDLLASRTTAGIRLGLERTRALLEKLGNPEKELRFIHFAGTNGKGSCVATCEVILRGQGIRTGTYTSPHLVDFRERIRIDGEMIGEAEVTSWLSQWLPAIEETGATFFEATTAMALEWFRNRGAEIVVLETGLGGRLDATNVVDPLAAAVVSIGLEHVDLLGGTVESISREKGGIFKRGRPAIIGHGSAAARAALRQAAEEAGAAPIIEVTDRYSPEEVSISARGTELTLVENERRVRLRTPLVGFHQATNLACSLATLSAAGPSFARPLEEVERSLASLELPGRFQRVGSLIFDVAHNPDGIGVLRQCIAAVEPPRPLVALVCILGDKDWKGMLTELGSAADALVLTDAPSVPAGRAWDLAAVAQFAGSAGLPASVEPDLDRAIALARRNGATCLVTGSFHTVGDVMSRLQLSPYTR